MSAYSRLLQDIQSASSPTARLGDFAAYSDTRVAADEVDETTYVGVDNLVADKGGKVASSYAPGTARLTAYEAGDVLIGNIRPYLKKVWFATGDGGCSGDVLALRVREGAGDRLLAEYLYFVLSSDTFFFYDVQNSRGGKMPRGSKDAILDFGFPLPPLELQTRVVRALRDFLDLAVGLGTELETRRGQYEFYRGSLASVEVDQHEWSSLGEVASVRVGRPPVDGVVETEGPFRYVNAGAGESGRSAEPNADADTITIPSRGQGGVGVVGYQDEPFWCGPLCYRIVADEAVLSTRFLYYYLKSVQDEIRGLQQTGGTPALNRKELVKVRVPLPSLEKQREVIAVLNHFDELTTSQRTGLPAEIRLRRQQYEYYRHELLQLNGGL